MFPVWHWQSIMVYARKLSVGVVLASNILIGRQHCWFWAVDRKHKFQVCRFDDNDQVICIVWQNTTLMSHSIEEKHRNSCLMKMFGGEWMLLMSGRKLQQMTQKCSEWLPQHQHGRSSQKNKRSVGNVTISPTRVFSSNIVCHLTSVLIKCITRHCYVPRSNMLCVRNNCTGKCRHCRLEQWFPIFFCLSTS